MIAALELAQAVERVVLYEETGGEAADEMAFGDFMYNVRHIVRHHLANKWPTVSTTYVSLPRVPWKVSVDDVKIYLTLLGAMATPTTQALRTATLNHVITICRRG